jgi:hypothetical protein
MRVVSDLAHSPNVKSMLTSFFGHLRMEGFRNKPAEGCIRIRMQRGRKLSATNTISGC